MKKELVRSSGMVRVVMSDKDEVERARKDLLRLLEDPYYIEAFLRLSKASKLPSPPPGIFPNKIGAYATKLANKRDQDQEKQRPGAPRKHDLTVVSKLDPVFSKHNLSSMEGIRRLLAGIYPTANKASINEKAKEFSGVLSGLRKQIKKNV